MITRSLMKKLKRIKRKLKQYEFVLFHQVNSNMIDTKWRTGEIPNEESTTLLEDVTINFSIFYQQIMRYIYKKNCYDTLVMFN